MNEKKMKNLEEGIAYLQTCGNIEYDPQATYDTRVMAVLTDMPTDIHYLNNIDKVEKKAEKKLQMEDISTFYTFLLRGERFGGGTIAVAINNGMLLKFFERELELLKREAD